MMKNMINFKNWLVSEEEIEVISTPTGDYCSGVSMNIDLWYSPQNSEFLKVKNKEELMDSLVDAAAHGNMKVFDKKLTLYDNNPESGFTYLIVLGQSHIIIHTWPEKGLLNLDVFTCGSEGDPKAIFDWIEMKFPPQHKQVKQNDRGIRKHVQNANEKIDKPSDLKPDSKFNALKSKNKYKMRY
jgi:S-adenosylmethionine decarboxylase